MIDWMHNLSVGALVRVVVTYLASGIYWWVMALAVGERACAFKAMSPGMLPPLGIIFGLLFAFIAAQVGSHLDRANVTPTETSHPSGWGIAWVYGRFAQNTTSPRASEMLFISVYSNIL